MHAAITYASTDRTWSLTLDARALAVVTYALEHLSSTVEGSQLEREASTIAALLTHCP